MASTADSTDSVKPTMPQQLDADRLGGVLDALFAGHESLRIGDVLAELERESLDPVEGSTLIAEFVASQELELDSSRHLRKAGNQPSVK